MQQARLRKEYDSIEKRWDDIKKKGEEWLRKKN